MPTYEFKCMVCETKVDIQLRIEERDDEYGCPHCARALVRQMAAPMVMTAAYPDGTKRFDSLRASIALDKAIKKETDKTAKAKLKAEQKKIFKESA